MYVLLIMGPKWKLEIIWETIESNKPLISNTRLEDEEGEYFLGVDWSS